MQTIRATDYQPMQPVGVDYLTGEPIFRHPHRGYIDRDGNSIPGDRVLTNTELAEPMRDHSAKEPASCLPS